MSHTKPCAQYHVLDQNHLTHSRVKINPYNPPFKLELGISHTPPYHLGLSPDFASDLLGVCMPYQVLQPYALLHANNLFSINFFSCASWWLHHHDPLLHPLVFPCSPSTMLPCTYIHTCHWCPYKKNPSIGLHGSSTFVTASCIGSLFVYMVHQSWFQRWD